MGIVLVNVTAARSSGALSILKQFLRAVQCYDSVDEFIVFVDKGFLYKEIENVRFVKINTQGWFKRIWWDWCGLKKWCTEHNIIPDVLISLQNTGSNLDVPQLIYYHQPLSLSDKAWNPLHRKERVLFCYKQFYSFFVKRFLTERTHVVVQIPSIKEAFVRKFRIDERQVSVLTPQVSTIDYSSISPIELDRDSFHFIYPATPFVYKNHIELVYAVQWLLGVEPRLRGKIKIYFTMQREDDRDLWEKILKAGLSDIFVFEGVIPFERLLAYYKSCNALLFPSYIESFGLPLLEAAGAGLPIVAMDLPYVHDVVGQYAGVRYAKLGNPETWGKAIREICDNPVRYNPFVSDLHGDWDKFFEILKNLK